MESTSVSRRLFDTSASDVTENFDSSFDDEAETSIQKENTEIERLENLIFSFMTGHQYKWGDERILKYAEKAQAKFKAGFYGQAIVRFKDLLNFIEDVEFSSKKYPEVGDAFKVQSAICEQISLCYLCSNNNHAALERILQSINYSPSTPLPHLWRAICNRRLNRWNAATKSFTTFITLYDMNEDTQRLSAEEQVSINNLWCLVMEQARKLLPTVKVDYFPVSFFKHISENEIKATMAMEFLQTHPAYHSVIVPDAKTVHIIPSHDGEGFSYERSYQVCGFIDADETSTYVANLPRTIEQLDFTLHSIFSASSTDQALEIWNVVGLLNSTTYKLSQHPGKEIQEHLMYCIKLVQTSNLRQALNEIRSIIVDLRVLPMLPDYEWGETSDDFMEAYTSSLEGAIRSIEEHFKDTLEKRRGIGRIERLLEECELKHRVKKRFKLLTSSCKKTPKKKITNKAKRLRSYTQ